MSYPYKTQFFLKHPTYEPPLDDEDPLVDPKNKLEPPCLEKCSKYIKLYDNCAKRVAENPKQHLQCLGQHYDVRHCVDNCIAKDLFRFVK